MRRQHYSGANNTPEHQQIPLNKEGPGMSQARVMPDTQREMPAECTSCQTDSSAPTAKSKVDVYKEKIDATKAVSGTRPANAAVWGSCQELHQMSPQKRATRACGQQPGSILCKKSRVGCCDAARPTFPGTQ
ncbi:hypothetical protein NDU88_001237 [Pleurodeles waltl]|uniref:Uncharacterized protein n=1 Tax=Pleurodeles waltl TaxID=8319 RepID=A0AAV7SB34_PLEWA|nr:hypothetical protein NDU88_001237 [Pleurodeles waltl]